MRVNWDALTASDGEEETEVTVEKESAAEEEVATVAPGWMRATVRAVAEKEDSAEVRELSCTGPAGGSMEG